MSDPMLTATSEGATVQSTPAQPAQGESAQQSSGSKLPPAWMAQLPKDLMDDPDLSQFDKLDKVARDWKERGGKLKELEAKLQSSAAIPGKDAKPEDWDKFYASIGRPEKASDYQFKREGDLANAPKLPGLDEWTAETYHKLGLTKAQAEGLFAENAKKALAIGAEIKAQNEAKAQQTLKELETRWGRDWQSKQLDLQASVKTFFGEGLAKDIMASPLANNADFLDRLAGLNKYMKEAPFRGGQPSGGSGRSAASTIFSKS